MSSSRSFPQESRKCARFVRTQLRWKRGDISGYVTDKSVESTNNRVEWTVRLIVTYRELSG